MIVGGNSAVSLAVSHISKEKQRVFISAGAGADSLTEEQCQPYMVRYTYSTSAQAIGTASAMVRDGGTKWYFLTADYAFGHSMEKASTDVVEALGGEVLGSVRHPLSTADFSSYLMQAQASGANVIGLAHGGGDLVNSVRTAKEFGVSDSMMLAGLVVFITDVHALGLETTAGLYLTDGWYWDRDDASREFSQRFYEEHQKMPTTFQAGYYSAVLSYLKAAEAAGTTDSDAVMEKLKSMEIADMFAQGYVRADGTMVHDMYLMQVKSPEESAYPWDYYKLVATIPGEEAYIPTKTGVCSLMPE